MKAADRLRRHDRERGMREKRSCAAIDLGASSGRVALIVWDGERLVLREVRRFDTPLRADPETGYQCWDLSAMEREVREGLAAAAGIAPLESIGVDGWGVDYVLLDAGRRQVGPAVSYRDDRARGVMPQVLERLPKEEVYRRTGIQFQPFNTLYQLAATAQRHPEWLARARHLLMLPDYFHHRLGGVMANEYTNATTTQLLGVDDWDDGLLGLAGISRDLVSPPVAPGTLLGEARVEGARATKIIAPGTHDTASAVAAIPLAPGEAFLISGTWSLMGFESQRPLCGEAALRANVTNEGGVERRYRVLKNITGLWLTQCIARELRKPEGELIAAAAFAPAWRTVIDPDDARFSNPPSMIAAVLSFCAETGQELPANEAALVRCVLESLALSYRRVKDELEGLLGRSLARIQLSGGGGQNRLLNQLTADTCQVPIRVGPPEGSLLGNGCVQLIGLGAIASLDEARGILRLSFDASEVEPRGPVPDATRQRFARLAQRHLRTEPPRAAPPEGPRGEPS
jgi:rhamnulokinase